jgi:hypothetical protein
MLAFGFVRIHIFQPHGLIGPVARQLSTALAQVADRIVPAHFALLQQDIFTGVAVEKLATVVLVIQGLLRGGPDQRQLLLSVVGVDKLERMFRLLFDPARVPELEQAGFLFVESLTAVPWQAGLAGAGAWLLVVLMGATTYYSQRQMMASNPAAAEQPHMKIMLYVMPVMLTVFAVNFPIGVLLYWVTTNLWTIGQQWVMFRNVGQTREATT